MRNQTQNETIEQSAIRMEQERHKRRLNEIKLMSARMAALQKYMPALQAAGVTIQGSEVDQSGKALNILHGFFLRRDAKKALEVLLAQGFREVSRDNHLSYVVIVIAKGHLQLRFSLDKHLVSMGPPAVYADPLKAA